MESHVSEAEAIAATAWVGITPKARITSRGLVLDDSLTFQEWEELGLRLRVFAQGIQFAIADWVNYGRDRWGEQAEQGMSTEREQQAANATGWAPETVEQYARVGRQVPPENRDPDLTFSHHREVADRPVDEQRDWLRRAKDENWTSDRLRGELRTATKPDAAVWLLVRCTSTVDREILMDRLRGEGREVKEP